MWERLFAGKDKDISGFLGKNKETIDPVLLILLPNADLSILLNPQQKRVV